MNQTITAIPGIEVGHWTDADNGTGCTVVVLPEPNVITAEVRGAAPGTREYALLQKGMRVEQAQAILLTGGSSFGLAAADGVVRGLVSDGRGHRTPFGRVPIVPAAVLFDLGPDDHGIRPGPDQGEAAYRAATAAAVQCGSVGAGTGATVAKWRGLEHLEKGGVGSACASVGPAGVGVLAAVNAVGDIFTVRGDPITGGDHVPGGPGIMPSAFSNTTLIVVATDAKLSRIELTWLGVRAHDALAVCVRPAHTRFDGDIAFAVSCGDLEGDVDHLAEAAFEATAAAIVSAVELAAL